jgi:hypothetical protein
MDEIASVVLYGSACQASLLVMQIQSYLEKQQEGAEDDKDEDEEDYDDDPPQPAAEKK